VLHAKWLLIPAETEGSIRQCECGCQRIIKSTTSKPSLTSSRAQNSEVSHQTPAPSQCNNPEESDVPQATDIPPEPFIPKPPNAFFIFRREYLHKHPLGSQWEASGRGNVSKDAATAWKKLSFLERQVYFQKATIKKETMLRTYPNWKGKRGPREKSNNVKRHQTKKRTQTKQPGGGRSMGELLSTFSVIDIEIKCYNLDSGNVQGTEIAHDGTPYNGLYRAEELVFFKLQFECDTTPWHWPGIIKSVHSWDTTGRIPWSFIVHPLQCTLQEATLIVPQSNILRYQKWRSFVTEDHPDIHDDWQYRILLNGSKPIVAFRITTHNNSSFLAGLDLDLNELRKCYAQAIMAADQLANTTISESMNDENGIPYAQKKITGIYCNGSYFTIGDFIQLNITVATFMNVVASSASDLDMSSWKEFQTDIMDANDVRPVFMKLEELVWQGEDKACLLGGMVLCLMGPSEEEDEDSDSDSRAEELISRCHQVASLDANNSPIVSCRRAMHSTSMTQEHACDLSQALKHFPFKPVFEEYAFLISPSLSYSRYIRQNLFSDDDNDDSN
jgi:hypothetical protein